jgi:hypothetical protein
MLRKTLLVLTLLALCLPSAGVPTSAAASAARADKATAWVRSPDHGVLKKGCSGHRYRYAVDVPDGKGDSWALEVFLLDSSGRAVASSYEIKGADAVRGKGRLAFCSLNVRPGRYKVKGRLTWAHYSDTTVSWTKPVRVRLQRP